MLKKKVRKGKVTATRGRKGRLPFKDRRGVTTYLVH